MTSTRRAPALVYLGSLLLYLSARSHFYNFDGVACAIAVDLSDFKHLVHGNHLAYGVVAWVFARLSGVEQSLHALQVLSALLGAGGAAVFASLLLRSGRTEREALLGGFALATSHAWWFWSLEAQVYMLGALFAALAAREALGEEPEPRLVGLWHGAAILGHAGHAMAAPALLWILLRAKGRKALPGYFGAGAGLVLGAYALAALTAVRPASFEEWRLWLLGSAALGADRDFAWHGAPPAVAVASWLRLCVEVFWARGSGFWLGALPLLAAARALWAGGARAKFWSVWLAGYAALYLFWEPGTIVYRVTDLLAFWALAFEGLTVYAPKWRAIVLAAWLAATVSHNLRDAVLPAADPANNADLQEALRAARDTPANAWVLAVGRGQVFIPYFAGRKPLNLRYLPGPDRLKEKLAAAARAGEPVYATERALDESGRRGEFEKIGLAPAAPGLYRVEARR